MFDAFDCREGVHGITIRPDFVACFECSTEHVNAGGDHNIIVGYVRRGEDREADPLIVRRSRFLQREGLS